VTGVVKQRGSGQTSDTCPDNHHIEATGLVEPIAENRKGVEMVERRGHVGCLLPRFSSDTTHIMVGKSESGWVFENGIDVSPG
jgi:hypothetical protein